uniref:TPR_REGION domain-containing protein n=1 Tax=Meloidogyne hapla TaxID=6305 RepID=A0A1I8BX25_MELHA
MPQNEECLTQNLDLLSENLKNSGNELYNLDKFSESVEAYSKALALKPENKLRLTVLKNRAMARLKLEDFEGAETDCDEEVARRFPKLEQSIMCLNLWAAQIEAKLGTDLTECPPDFLPNMHVQELSDSEQHQNSGKQNVGTPTLNKYHNLLLEHGNTPFEYDEPGVKPVRRLWIQLVHQESLMPIFVRFIFGKEKTKSLSSFTDGSVESRYGRQATPKNIISQFLKILN